MLNVHSFSLESVVAGEEHVVHDLAHSEDGGPEQQAQEPANLSDQTQQRKRHVLLHILVLQLLVEDVHLQEIQSMFRGGYWGSGDSRDFAISRFTTVSKLHQTNSGEKQT